MGGEKIASWTVCNVSMGSPPHGRGKDFSAQHPERGRGITPAWAGKSEAMLNLNQIWWDHPRMGGEKLLVLLSVGWWLGSPPHGRGKGVCHGKCSRVVRITPAWAGKSQYHNRRTGGSEDHPRMGGEKSAHPSQQLLWKGSPPHGRGKVQALPLKWLSPRITPAWAGKSFCSAQQKGKNGDHPRMGGEKPTTPIPR